MAGYLPVIHQIRVARTRRVPILVSRHVGEQSHSPASVGVSCAKGGAGSVINPGHSRITQTRDAERIGTITIQKLNYLPIATSSHFISKKGGRYIGMNNNIGI